MVEMVSAEIDELFGPSKKHVYERKEWVAVAKVDDHEQAGSGGKGPIDLDSGIVHLPRPVGPEPS
ncbi:MAG TPA: DUF6191 domain-containing protein [Pseudonocardiaceae bacterium]|jgi:hypothetical protein|nr:DUF6191 domain-containing protein [Pseudonocardiaceae bacterium]